MRVLVADNDPLILDALKQLLPQLTPEIVLARDRASAEVALGEDPRFELLLLDLALPDAPGLDFLAELKQGYPGMSIVVLSAPHDETIYAALSVGAEAFIPKTANINSLLRALRFALLENDSAADERCQG